MPDQPNVVEMEEDCAPPENSPKPETGIGLAAELLIGLFVTGFALFVIIESLCMPHRAKAFIMDPGFVPLISGIALLTLVCILDVRALRSGGAGHVRDLIHMIKNRGGKQAILVDIGLSHCLHRGIDRQSALCPGHSRFLGGHIYLP